MPVETATEMPFRSLASQMNKMMEGMNKGYYGFRPNEPWQPNVNLYESDSAYHVCVDLAGVDKEKIDLVVQDGRLVLKGSRGMPAPGEQRPADPQSKRLRIHLMEIDHGPFSREVELPEDAQPEKIGANYRNGLLWVEVPKRT